MMTMVSKKHSIISVFGLKGSVLLTIWQKVLATVIFTVVITILFQHGFTELSQPSLASLIPGIVLGLLLVFRTNTAYERFWEGRKMIGGMIDVVRLLSRQLWVAIPVTSKQELEGKHSAIKLLLAFFVASKLHLRREPADEILKSLVSPQQYAELQQISNMPLKIAEWLGAYVEDVHDRKQITDTQLLAYNELIDRTVEAMGSCERILNTPMPLAYSIHLKHLLFLYCFAVPFQLVHDLGWWTIPASGIISFALLGIEAIGIEIENPFGYDVNDIPLDRLTQELMDEVDELMSFSRTKNLVEVNLNNDVWSS
jgi:putative membrane protein